MPEPAKAFDVIVAGELYTDLILAGFDFWPQPGQEAFAKTFHREIGGGASITACGLAKLGSRTALLGIIGEDDTWLPGQLQLRHIDTSQIIRDPVESSAFTVAVTTPEDRAFFTYPGANRNFPAALAEAAAANRLSSARHVHLAFAPDLSFAADLLTAIRRNGCTISLDVGWHKAWLNDPRLPDIFPLLDLFFPNETEAHAITGKADPEPALRWFSAAGLPRIALKLGARGAALLWDGEIQFAAPLPVTSVDTTGAGDCFNAGFLHSWLRGDPPAVALQAGNICGALSTQAYGGIEGFPSATRLEELLTCEK